MGRLKARSGLFGRNRKGSVAVVTAMSLLPIMLATGMSLDYAAAARRRQNLNAAADAAAILAVTPYMMAQPTTAAQIAALSLFNSQAAEQKDVVIDPTNTKVVVTDTPTVNGTVRAISVAYKANSPTVFAALLQMMSIPIGGTSKASATTAPNVDFYLLLDDSPSMAIAATQAGIDTMVKNTPKQSGCAFACHETNPAADNLGNPGGIDNYQLAKNLNVTLRMDLVAAATSNLMSYAMQTAAQVKATYRASVTTFDYQTTNVVPLTGDLSWAQQQSSTIQVQTMYKGGWRSATVQDNDTDTDWDRAMTEMASTLPKPGNGTNNPGDSPQEVLFIVTDGVADETTGPTVGSGRKMFAMGGNICTTIKAKGVRIAILYTVYNPLPTNVFYNTNIKPFQPSIPTTLQACATPGLFTAVNTNDDISSALQSLFNKAIISAHLTY